MRKRGGGICAPAVGLLLTQCEELPGIVGLCDRPARPAMKRRLSRSCSAASIVAMSGKVAFPSVATTTG